MKIFQTILVLAALLFSAKEVRADSYSDGPLGHAPIGVMGDHTHNEGEWMASYRFSRMGMVGNRDGTDSQSASEVLDDFAVSPLHMIMEMHMFGLMYGVSDQLTMMAMIPYVRKAMDHRTAGGAEFETEARGIGDSRLTGLYTIYDQDNHKVHLNGGFAFPTGSITHRDTTPANSDAKLPYPMQIGSGTLDPILGVTYAGHDADTMAWGVQATAMPRFGKNNEGYRLGDEYSTTAWVAKGINSYLSASIRADGKVWSNIDGQDRELNPAMIPTARTDLRGGERLDLLVGFNVVLQEIADIKELKGHRLAIEGGAPVYQRLDGPQLETDYRFTIGWQKSF